MNDQQRPAGFFPFWFWNDLLMPEEVEWQVDQMHAQGVKGFFIHSRQGLKNPYLSDSFFAQVDTATARAKRHGMEVHLYDEYPYPSGVAGGEVTLGNPHFYATLLVQSSQDADGGHVRLELPRGKILNVTAYPLNNGAVDWSRPRDLRQQTGMVLIEESYVKTGLTNYNRKRFFSSNPTPILDTELPPGRYRVFISAQVELEKFKYWDQYVDVMNPSAVQEFMRLTHERYASRYKDEFGSSMVSIFVDETAPGWSECLPERFEAAYGRDLLPLLPALQDPTHPEHTQVTYDLYQLKYKVFCETFEEPIAQWCQAHGIAYSGEKAAQCLAQLRYMDIPGCDPGHIKAGGGMDIVGADLRKNAKAAASIAQLDGKAGSLCECYHSLGWTGTLQDAKLIAEGLWLAGINYLVPHGFFYTTHGLAKHDAPPSFFFQMPYWPLFGQLSRRLDTLNELFAGTYINSKLFVLDANSGMPSQDQKQAYQELLTDLMASHIDFHIVDLDTLQRAVVDGTRLTVGGVTAEAVITTPMQVVEENLAAWLQAYAHGGGRIIRCPEPYDRDALQNSADSIQPSLSLLADGAEAAELWSVRRSGSHGDRWFVLNTTAQPLQVTINAGKGLRELVVDAEHHCRLQAAGGTKYTREIEPLESFVLADDAASATAARPESRLRLDARQDCTVSVEQKNLLRMYEWEMALQNEDGTFGPAAVVEAIPLSNQLEESGLAFAPKVKYYFGHAPELQWPELTVRYRFSFVNAYSGQVELVMEPDTLRGDWSLQVNNGPQLTREAFSPTDAHVRGSLGVDITPYLQAGDNVVEIIVDAADHGDGLINCLYLAGDFGVTLDSPTLTERPQAGRFEDYVGNQLPFFAGVVDYTLNWEIAELPETEECIVVLDGGPQFREAAELSINDDSLQPILWEPRSVSLRTDSLRLGQNVVRVRVYTSLGRSFEGEWFDYVEHETKPVE